MSLADDEREGLRDLSGGERPRWLVWAESVVLTLALPIVGTTLDASDPFFLRHDFSWALLPPLLVALRHGAVVGTACATLLVALLVGGSRIPMGQAQPHSLELLAGLIGLSAFAGAVADRWRGENDRLSAKERRLSRHVDLFARGYVLAELSHERLERRVGRDRGSLRESLVTVERQFGALREATAEPSPPEARARSLAVAGQHVLRILAAYGEVKDAALYAMEDRTTLAPTPVAVLGSPAPVSVDHPLVRTAIRRRRMTYARPDAKEEAPAGAGAETPRALLVLPLVDADGGLQAVVVVTSLPFVAWRAANLRVLASVTGHVADAIARFGLPTTGLDAQRLELEGRLRRAVRDAAETETESTVLVLLGPRGSDAATVLEPLVRGELRALDFPLVLWGARRSVALIVLLPLTDGAGAFSLRQRLERRSRERNGRTLTALGASIETMPVRDTISMNDVIRRVEELTASDDFRGPESVLP